VIGLRVYSFARIGAALGMAVEDVYTQNRRLWVRLREKGGKRHAMPCHNRVRNVPSNGATHGGSANCSLYRMAEIVAVTRSMT
jgi:integrase